MSPPRASAPRTPRPGPHAPLLAALSVLWLTACGPGTVQPPPPPQDAVAGTLGALGVSTAQSPRKAPDGSALDADSAPLGAAAAFGHPDEFTSESGANPTMELVIARNFFDDDTLVVEQIDGAQVTQGGTIELGSETVLKDLTDGNSWISPDYSPNDYFHSLRDIAAGDLDGDGFDEIAAAYVDPADDVLKLRTFGDDRADYVARTSSLAQGSAILSVKLLALDDDGDGSADLMVALSFPDRVELSPITSSASGYALDDDATITLAQQVEGSHLYVRLAGGQLDYDNGHELGVVVNETDVSSTDFTGLAMLYVYDDAAAGGRGELLSRSVQATLAGVVAAQSADIALDDIDGDGLDEVVIAGATNLAESCEDDFAALLLAFDDAANSFALIDATVEELLYSNCPSFNSWRRLFVFVATPDLDGDGVHEIAANQLVFDDFAQTPEFTLLEDVELPDDAFLDDNFDAGQYLSVGTFAYVAADVTGDGRENVMVYHPNRLTMPVWGLSAISTIGPNANGWAVLSQVSTPGQHNPQELSLPLLVPANVDADGPLLKYSAGSHQLVFTEPLLIAALAAPPCQATIAQNLSACVTSFGQGSGSTVDASLTITLKASVTAGIEADVNVPFLGEVGAEFQKTVSLSASVWAGTAYTVEKTVTYSTGSLEDGVVFTSIPYDVYRYEILSHPDPELVGKDVVIRIPREPITMIAEREFFNAALPSTGTPIGANVFDHAPGEVDSYPSSSRKASLLSQHGGIEFGPIGVGQGAGQTELEIAVLSEISAGGSLALEYEKSLKLTSGVAFAEFTIGYGAEAALSFTSGSMTTYTGVVGSISAADFAANAYQWGIFTYVQSVGDQKVEVINYWVE